MDNTMGELVEILKLLISTRPEGLSILQVAKKRKVNYKTAYEAVQKLVKEGVLDVKKIGRASYCTFNNRFNPTVFMAENSRREELLRNKDLRVMYEKLNALPRPFIALVFGSYAKGKAGKGSDIDLLVIGDEKDTKKVQETLSLLPLQIHVTAATQAEFLSMANSREFTVVSEAIKNNVILIGVEEYYRLMQHAR